MIPSRASASYASPLITATAIRAAYEAYIRPVVRHTPLFTSASIARKVGCEDLHLKMENLQRTGSFKIRGATCRIAQLTDEERLQGVITASAGNHAQGVALAARTAGVAATVFMPRNGSIAKIQATENYGATVILEGANFDEAVAAAQARSTATGAVFISAYDDDAIITGQGSLGIELLEDLPDVETVLIPIGGGGLFSGVATAIKAARPLCRIIGIQAAGADSAARSFRTGRLSPRDTPCDTIADGIAIKSPSPRTFAYIQRYADDVVTVSDEAMAAAILLLMTRAKVVVEPSGAAGLAALMEHPSLGVGRTATLLCGGNIDVKLLADLIERGMIRARRYFHFFTAVSDKPGGLARLLEAVAKEGGNVMEVTHNRISPGVAYGMTGVEMLVEVRNEAHIAALEASLTEHGFHVRHLS
ncbi:MAG: threonine ammonia-lyase [Cytophagales bacterium]|nr:threonine ammonia-lyase [Armatimonadota bacterium]